MAHPLYHQATRLVGQSVHVHHINGARHHGTLMSVAPHGIFLIPHPVGTRLVASQHTDLQATPTLAKGQQNDIDLVYSPAAYFGFGALTGLTAAALFSPFWW